MYAMKLRLMKSFKKVFYMVDIGKIQGPVHVASVFILRYNLLVVLQVLLFQRYANVDRVSLSECQLIMEFN